jgi:hypothetical protein
MPDRKPGGASLKKPRMRIATSCYALTGLGYATPWSVNAGFIAGSQETLIVDTGACALSAATIHG